jgi:hypothetical protein
MKEDKSVEAWTPAKRLGLVSKTMSAAHLNTPSMNVTLKKEKKVSTTGKKDKAKVQSVANLLETNYKRR